MEELPTGQDRDPPQESGGVGSEPGREAGSDTPHLTRGSATEQPQRKSGAHASFDPDLAEGGALPHTDALDPPNSGVPLAPEGGPSARDAAPVSERNDQPRSPREPA